MLEEFLPTLKAFPADGFVDFADLGSIVLITDVISDKFLLLFSTISHNGFKSGELTS